MDLPGIVIEDNDKIIDLESKAIERIIYFLDDKLSSCSDNALKYYSYLYLDFPKEDGDPIEKNIEFTMWKNTQTNEVCGTLDNFAQDNMQSFKGNIRIKPTGELGGYIDIIYKNVHFRGDITGETLTEGFSAFFTCSSVLHSDDNSMEFPLNFSCYNDITDKCSVSGICNEISKGFDNMNILPYDKYIAGWKKIGQAYRYISPDTHSTFKHFENPILSIDALNSIFKYIDNDFGMLIFAHCLKSIVMSMGKMRYYGNSILNIEGTSYAVEQEKEKEYISSIVHSFWMPEITVNNRYVSNFVLNRKFNVSSCMPNIGKLKKENKEFKDFPVFLHGEYVKKDIYSSSSEAPMSLKTQISNADLKYMFNSGLSFICYNADNQSTEVVNFKQNKFVDVTVDKQVTENIIMLVAEYINFLEKSMHHTIILSRKNTKLIERYNELLYEFRFNILGEFLSKLKRKIRELAYDEFIILCRHINYSDVLELYRNTVQCSESFTKASEFIAEGKFNRNFNIFKRDIIEKSKKRLNRTDFRYLERAEICCKYFEKLNYDIEYDFSHILPDKDYKSLNTNLKRKCKLYLQQYRERLIIKFAGSMDYNVKLFDEWSDYAKNAMNKHKHECTKTTLKYCEGLLAAAYGFTAFLREKYNIGDDICNNILYRVENLYQHIYSEDEVKTVNDTQKVQIFRAFISSCRILSGKTLGTQNGLNPIYTDEALQNIEDKDKKDTIQPIGWYDFEKDEYILIKKDKTNLSMKQPPVETVFKDYLKNEGLDSDFVWSTFVSKQLYPRGIVKGTKMSKKQCSRYDYKKTVDSKQYTVYYMYLQ
ncbi:MAG: hypothetical protein K2K57_01575 [Oscillospiraceae bacterium]|nr:hypothetical protein [Oscillospiraceae bacterium]